MEGRRHGAGANESVRKAIMMSTAETANSDIMLIDELILSQPNRRGDLP